MNLKCPNKIGVWIGRLRFRLGHFWSSSFWPNFLLGCLPFGPPSFLVDTFLGWLSSMSSHFRYACLCWPKVKSIHPTYHNNTLLSILTRSKIPQSLYNIWHIPIIILLFTSQNLLWLRLDNISLDKKIHYKILHIP